jgi:hypothetical protein
MNTDRTKLAAWLNNSFKHILLYESFLATGDQNSVNSLNAPKLFQTIKTNYPGLDKLIQIWNQAIFQQCLESLSEHLEKIKNIKSGDTYWESVEKCYYKANRNLKIIGSISQAKSEQMVLADFGLIIAMLGNIPDNCITQGFITFDDFGYTIPQKDNSGPIEFVTGLDFEKAVEILEKVIDQ